MSITLKARNVRQDMNDRSENQLITLCVQCLDEMGQIIGEYESTDERLAAAIKFWRSGGGEFINQRDMYIDFAFDGCEYTLANEEFYRGVIQTACEDLASDCIYEFDKLMKDFWFADFCMFDVEKFCEHLEQYEEHGNLLCTYDGHVEEIQVNAYDVDGCVYRTGEYYYLWRTN